MSRKSKPSSSDTSPNHTRYTPEHYVPIEIPGPRYQKNVGRVEWRLQVKKRNAFLSTAIASDGAEEMWILMCNAYTDNGKYCNGIDFELIRMMRILCYDCELRKGVEASLCPTKYWRILVRTLSGFLRF